MAEPYKNNYYYGSSVDALEEIKSILGETIRVLLSDGRLVEGEFQCMDKDLNFILGGATEFYGLKDKIDIEEVPPTIIRRNLGMAMVPGKHVVRVMHLAQKTEDQI